MKTLIRGLKLCLLLIIFLFSLGIFNNADAYVKVNGYTRKDGTYVKPYVRSNPNGVKYDNYGYTPNQGLYNKTYGTKGAEWDTPTYITDPNYYEGKALYDSGTTDSSSLYTYTNPTVTAPTKTCTSGHYLNNGRCDEIVPPKNARITGNTWTCNFGYYATADKLGCTKIILPVNGHPTEGNNAGSWDCDFGYYLNDTLTGCNKIILPRNSHATGNTAGSWQCNVTYKVSPDLRSCVKN